MSESKLTPVAWRYRYIHPGRVNHWIVRQSPIMASEAQPGLAAVEVEPLYPSVAAELYEALEQLLAITDDPHNNADEEESIFPFARRVLAKASVQP